MRYWGLLLGKLAAAIGLSYLLFLAIDWAVPAEHMFVVPGSPVRIEQYGIGRNLGYTAAMLVWFLISAGLVWLCVWDHRYRCRVCLRRMRMPIETGSWGQMLQFGRPETEYICTYGHGRLNVSELQLHGKESPEWKAQGDYWDELVASSTSKDDNRPAE